MANLPQIKVTLFLSGDEFNVDSITEQLNIMPTRIREKKDFPIKEFAHTYWSVSTQKESCKAVSIQFKKIMEILVDKENIIRNICDIYKVNATFTINIYMENGDRPEMFLTKDIVCFLASINAEVGFDLYID